MNICVYIYACKLHDVTDVVMVIYSNSWNCIVRSQHCLKWEFKNYNDMDYECEEGINQWWQGQGCLLCYRLGGMTIQDSKSTPNILKTSALPNVQKD